MYIDAFWAGILFTILVEMLLLFVYAIWKNHGGKR